SEDLVKRLWHNGDFMKAQLQDMGFDIGHSTTPIIPLMLGDAHLARDFSRRLMDNGVFAMAIGYPTVPQGLARIRVMNTAAHSEADLEEALAAFNKVGKELQVIL
ncbi:MAG: aminotransferase class I/II-fold pyridoxal phosphate-dependent enzyme, partial [Chloroflexota bacterium]